MLAGNARSVLHYPFTLIDVKRVFIKTYGCQMNERDSEAVAQMLAMDGYEIAEDEALADVILVNTCAVRELAEEKAMGKVRHLFERREKEPALRVGIMGCMAQNRGRALLNKLPGLDMVVGTQQIHHIPEMLDRLFAEKNAGGKSRAIVETGAEEGSQNAISLHADTRKPCAFVSIMQGCNMRCTYCIVPKTRGRERCRPIEDIVSECAALAKRGTKEVTLLGQIVTSYGRREIPVNGGKSPFVQLIEEVAKIDGIERIRFTSPHPRGFKEDLVDAFTRIPKLMPCVNLPLQSGSDAILRAMNRPYSVERYYEIVDSLKKAVPEICITTDVIVGFPGETDDDFQRTVDAFERVRFDMAYIFKYSPRPGSPGGELADNVPDQIKDARNEKLLDLVGAYSLLRHKSLVGTVQQVLVEGPARRGENCYTGRNPGGRKVVFKSGRNPTGEIVPVTIARATPTTVEGVPALIDELRPNYCRLSSDGSGHHGRLE
jgi:tRNA-2-methylthio-N6-dimethylallyladenosine synthase